MRRLKTGDQALEHCQTGRPSTPQNEPQTRGPVARNLLIGLGAGGRAPSFFFISARFVFVLGGHGATLAYASCH